MSKIKAVQIAVASNGERAIPLIIDDKGRVWMLSKKYGFQQLDLPDEPGSKGE